MFDQHLIDQLQKKIPALPRLVAEKNLVRDIDDLVAGTLPPMKLAVIDDARTGHALGDQVFRALKDRFPTIHVMLEGIPKADDETANSLRTQTISCDALVAVGSGTINDLCKYVSHLDKKPYVVFPTAASMNGYSSANASIAVGGYKKTKPAHLPSAIFCDMGIIARAPARFSCCGFGDSVARPTAQADWLLSHLLLGTAYDETPFDLLKDIELQLFDNARGIALQDPAVTALLMRSLLLSGFGMTIAGGSYPASGGEHMIAHAYEMANESAALHGETIAITTLYMAELQQSLLRGKPRFRPGDFDAKQLQELYGEEVSIEAKKAFEAKQQLMHKNGIANWEGIAGKIEAISLPMHSIETILKAAGAPTSLKQIGWEKEAYKMAIDTARFLRERFGFLDLA